MELRELTTEHERDIFARCVEEARATRGNRFKETARSQLGRAHLAFATLYALFENESDPAEKMIAGFRIHDLATLPQSFPRPDMSHLPAQFTFEGGELWSLSSGAGGVAMTTVGAMLGIRQARAMLIYGIAKPVDLCARWEGYGYVRIGKPILWPFAETVDHGKIWVQPMIVEGENLERYVRAGYELLFGMSKERRAVRFENPLPMRVRPSAAAIRPEANISTGRPGISNGRTSRA